MPAPFLESSTPASRRRKDWRQAGHPDQVAVTARSAKMEADGFFARVKRRGEPEMSLIDGPPSRQAEALDAPIVGVAVNLDDMTAELA